MGKDKYLIGAGLKVDFYIEDCSIDFYLPDSNELQYPLEIYYTRYDYNGWGIKAVDTIVSAEDYLNTMKWFKECGYKIHEIGPINIENLRKYMYELNQYVYDLCTKLDKLHNETIKLVKNGGPELELQLNKELDPVYHLQMDLRKTLNELKNKMPCNTCPIYPEK